MFWENFVELCSRQGTSPNAVAAQIGKSSGSVTAWKNGTVPRETTLKKIADYFNVSIGYLIGLEEKEKPALPEESELDRALISRLVQLSPDEQEKVDAFVQGLIASR